jgi:hypothetical protein
MLSPIDSFQANRLGIRVKASLVAQKSEIIFGLNHIKKKKKKIQNEKYHL